MSKDITTYPESLDIKSEALKMSKDITTYLECLDIKNFEGIVRDAGALLVQPMAPCRKANSTPTMWRGHFTPRFSI